MQKLIVALSAVLITGLAGFSITGGDAQEARLIRPAQAKKIEVEEVKLEDERFAELKLVQLAEEEAFEVYLQRANEVPQFRMLNVNQGQPGTWQIVTHDGLALLLNTATGETFSLQKNDEGLHWKPIARPQGMDVPMLPSMPNFRRSADKADRQGIEERLEALRDELRRTKGDGRDKLEKAIEELEKSLEKSNKEDVYKRDAEAKRERDKSDTEDALREIEEAIADLKARYEESDSVKEREKIEKAIAELKEKAEGLRKERKTTR
jgi:hypothetical protein